LRPAASRHFGGDGNVAVLIAFLCGSLSIDTSSVAPPIGGG
jgi:hypothetical protein